jgi:hypothetical protein
MIQLKHLYGSVGVDLDGVVHGYRKGWQGGALYDDPVPGAVDALHELMDANPVFIFTSRLDLRAVAIWLRVHGLSAQPETDPDREFWNTKGTLLVTNRKLPAVLYVDDRAVRFTTWERTLVDIGLREAPPSAEDIIRELHVADADGYCVVCCDDYYHDRVRLRFPCPTVRAFDR